MVDVTEILQHWYAGRPKVEVARSLGVDAKTVRRYVAPAEAAGMAPGGPPVSQEQWRALARQWFPQLAGTGIRQVSWREIAVHHDRIAGLLAVVPVSVIHQRLADEQGLTASVASVRRYVRAHFPGEARAGQVRPPRPPVAAGCRSPGGLRVPGAVAGSGDGPAPPGVGVLDGAAVLAAPVRPPGGQHDPAGLDRGARGRVRVLRRGAAASSRRTTSRPGCASRTCMTRRSTAGTPSWPAITGAWSTRRAPTIPGTRPLIEAHQRYIRSSFFAGRSWASLAAMTADAETWCVQVAGQRRPRALEGRTVAEVFAAEEARALLPLPEAAFEPATWSRPKVAPDAHAMVGRTLYSVPYRLIGKRLDARATAAMVEFYLDGELVKTHLFQPRAGGAPTGPTCPSTRPGSSCAPRSWCQSQAGMVGPACAALVGELLSVNALFRLRQAQGVLRLGQRHGDARLEAACAAGPGGRRPVLPDRQGHPGRGHRARRRPAAAARHRRARLAARPGRVRR